MIECRRCSFEVSNNLRFSLMRNTCPSCGGALLSDTDMQEIESIKNELLLKAFSEGFSNDVLHDLTLFIFNEYVKPLQQEVLDAIDPDETDEEAIKRKIKEEVKSELAREIGELTSDEDEDEDLKVARLKRMAAEGIAKAGKIDVTVGKNPPKKISRSS